MATFEEVMKVNVNEKTEKKGNLTYLSWAWAWAEFKKLYPDATYEVKKFDGLPYVHDTDTGYMVYTSVTADGLTYEMWLPVMDARNKTLMTATMFDINKTIMRCLAKNLAMFGLGLYIYAGEDLPEDEQGAKSPAGAAKADRPRNEPREAATPQRAAKAAAKPAQTKQDKTLQAFNREILVKGTARKLGDMPAQWLRESAEKAQDKTLKEDMLLVAAEKFKEEMRQSEEVGPFDDDPFAEGKEPEEEDDLFNTEGLPF